MRIAVISSTKSLWIILRNCQLISVFWQFLKCPFLDFRPVGDWSLKESCKCFLVRFHLRWLAVFNVVSLHLQRVVHTFTSIVPPKRIKQSCVVYCWLRVGFTVCAWHAVNTTATPFRARWNLGRRCCGMQKASLRQRHVQGSFIYQWTRLTFSNILHRAPSSKASYWKAHLFMGLFNRRDIEVWGFLKRSRLS